MSTDALRPDALTLPRRRERSFLRELERPSHVFRNIGPNWFAAVMGTGIVANALVLLPFDWPAARDLAVAPWALAVVLLVAITAATAVHWVHHSERARRARGPPLRAPPRPPRRRGDGALLRLPADGGPDRRRRHAAGRAAVD